MTLERARTAGALIVAAALMVGAWRCSPRYETVVTRGAVYRLDRWTGELCEARPGGALDCYVRVPDPRPSEAEVRRFLRDSL